MPRYAIRPQVLARSLGDETVVLDAESGMYFRLNRTGTVVWERLQTAATLEEVVAHLARTCSVPAEEVQDDVIMLLASLQDRGLLDVGT